MFKLIKKLVFSWGINALAIYLCSVYLVQFNYDSWQILALVSLVFTLISLIAKPFLKILSLPFLIFAPIFYFVVYAGILFGISRFMTGFDTGDLKTAVEAGAIIAVVNFVAHFIFR